jgi:SAM-dependent methyltransferase
MGTDVCMTGQVATIIPDQRVFWDLWHEAHTVASHVDHALEAVNAFTAATGAPPCPVLEIGCGQGREAVELARRGYDVCAFDHSPVAIAIARSSAHGSSVDVRFSEHDATDPLPYPDRAFSGVFAHLSLHYFDEDTTARIFEEIARVLRPSGTVFFTVRSVKDSLFGRGERVDSCRYCLDGHLRHFFDMEYAYRLLSSWDIEDIEYYDTSARAVNPGVFLRVTARRPRALASAK